MLPGIHPILKKLQFKDHGQPVLILNAPLSYQEVEAAFSGEIHRSIGEMNQQQYEVSDERSEVDDKHNEVNDEQNEVSDQHNEVDQQQYEFVQVFGTSNDELSQLSRQAVNHVQDDGLLWLCYPKKSSKQYKGSDCSRESVTPMLAEQGYEPVRQIAIDEDWSALRFRRPEHIKNMVRTFATTEEGKKRTES